MARIRSIKPEFFLHDGLGELEPIVRLFFIGLWTQADREGRMEYRPKRLKASLLPYDDLNADEAVKTLQDAGFVTVYEVENRAYLMVNKFDAHQSPNIKERASTIPAPCQHSDCTSLKELKESKGTLSRAHARDDDPTPLSLACDRLQSEYATFPTLKQRETLSVFVDRYPDEFMRRLDHGIAVAKDKGKENIGFALACAERASAQELDGVSVDDAPYEWEQR